jgi:HPt (histidine-containing phosphotransfer) domain-containing protein
MDDYLTKPVSIDELRAALDRCVPLAAVAPFSRKVLEARFKGDQHMVDDILDSFRAYTPQTLSQLEAAVATADREQIGLLAHSIKGAGLMICASDVATAAAALERSAPCAPSPELATEFERLARAFDALLRQLPSPEPTHDALRARCVAACEECVSACEAALRSDDPSASPGAGPYSALHLSLLSCSSVCAVVASSLAGGLGNAAEMARWCAEVCRTCRAIVLQPDPGQPVRAEVAAACGHCEKACGELLAALHGPA